MPTPELSRTVRQLDNDVQSIYELLEGISETQSRHTTRLDELADKLEGHDQRFDAIDGRLDGHDGRLDTMDGKLDEILSLLRSSDS